MPGTAYFGRPIGLRSGIGAGAGAAKGSGCLPTDFLKNFEIFPNIRGMAKHIMSQTGGNCFSQVAFEFAR